MQKFWLNKIKSIEQGSFLIGWFGLLLFFISYPIKIFDTSIVAHVIFALGIYSLSAINRIVFMAISLAGALYLMAAFALHVVTYFFLPEQIAVYSVFRANEIFPIVFLTLISVGVLLRVATGALFVRYKDLMAYPLVILIDGIIISIILLQVLRYQEVSVIRATTIQQAQTVINILKISTTNKAAVREYINAHPEYVVYLQSGDYVYSASSINIGRWTYQQSFLSNNNKSHIIISPTDQLINKQIKIFPILVLITLLVMILLLSVVVLLWNITHEQRERLLYFLKERLQYQKSIEEANSRLQEFAYIVSHDLRSPLQNIKDLISMLRDAMGEGLSADSLRYMDLLVQRSSHMDKMIDGILHYSRIGTKNFPAENIKLAVLLEEIADDIALDKTVLEYKDLPQIYTYHTLLREVLQNLITNSVKYAAVDNLKIKISVQDAGDFYQLTVADNGVGIPGRNLKKIFTMFYTTGGEKYKSTGIGLAIVKKIIDKVGGSIEVLSSENKGVKFNILWPKKVMNE